MIVIYYIRTIIIFTLVFLFLTVFSLIALPIIWLVGKFSLPAREKCARKVAGFALRTVCFVVGVKFEGIGMENIPDEPCLFVGNHRSFFDVITTYPLMHGRRLGFVGKDSFSKVFTFKLWMEWCGCLFINRKNPREGMRTISAAAEDLKNGKSIWIYPEGTRNHGDELLEFHRGSFKIAEKARCKIVPVCHVHMDDAFELHMPYTKPVKTKTIFAEAIPTEGLDREGLKEAYDRCVAEIDRMYKEYY